MNEGRVAADRRTIEETETNCYVSNFFATRFEHHFFYDLAAK